MTGGIPSGAAIAGAAAPHMTRLQLELGGSNPAIVRADADVAATGEALAHGITKLSGQWCEGPRRVFVAAALHDDLVDATCDALRRLRHGSSLDPTTQVGPIAHSAHLATLQRQLAALDARGGRRVEAGELPADGFRQVPTLVLGLAPDAVLEEIFGPVVTVHAVCDDAEALQGANLGTDGLAGYVFGRDEEARRRARHAAPRRGDQDQRHRAARHVPLVGQSFFGSSGVGGHDAPSLFDFFRGVRIVGVDDPALAF